MPRFQQIEGNLWLTRADAVVITTNGEVNRQSDPPKAIMGTGTAEQAKKLFPGIDERLAGYLDRHTNRPFRLGWYPIYGDGGGAEIVSMPVKNNVYQKADPEIIRASAGMLVEMADKFGWKTIAMPRPGCGAGKLEWDQVLASGALDVLDQRFIIVSLPPDPAKVVVESQEHLKALDHFRRRYAVAMDNYARSLVIALRNGEVNIEQLRHRRQEFHQATERFHRVLEAADLFMSRLRMVEDQSEPEENVTF